MSRDGSGVYHRPVGTDAVTDTTIESTKYNINVADVEQDLNLPRPIVAGGTGATTPAAALLALSGETAKQIVTNYDSQVWLPGSFYSSTTALGTVPVAAHAFAGIAYYANATDLVLEATDLTDAADTTDATDPSTINQYIRVMTSGVWGAWRKSGGSTSPSTGDYLFDSTITFPPASGQIRFNNATENSTTEVFISHTTAAGLDNTGVITASVKSGYNLYIQDKDEPVKYKSFVTTADPVLSGGDFRVTVTFISGGADIVSAQRVLLSANTGSAVRYDIAQTLTVAQQTQARTNIAADPLSSPSNNLVINGDMMISQENAVGAVVTPIANNPKYLVDTWVFYPIQASMVATWTAGVSTPTSAYPGLINQINATVGTPFAPAVNDGIFYMHVIEGQRWAKLGWGKANASAISIGFWVFATIAGTAAVTIRNGGLNRSYVTPFTIAAANTWQYNTVTVPGDITGTWATDTGIGAQICFCFGSGNGFSTPNTLVWQAGNFLAQTGITNFFATNGNTVSITGVSMIPGIVPVPREQSASVRRDVAEELRLCQRYYQILTGGVTGYVPAASAQGARAHYPVAMRAVPTITPAFTYTNASGGVIDNININNFRFYGTATANVTFEVNLASARCDARL